MSIVRRRFTRAGFAALAFAVLALAAPALAAPTSVDWKELGPGASRATLIARDGVTQILLFRFGLDHYRAEVVVGAGWPPRPATAADLCRDRRAIAAVNGGFFDERRRPLGLRIAQSVVRVPLRPKVDWGVLLLDAAGARIVHSRDFDGHASASKAGPSGAIQVGPRLVGDGRALQLKPQRARRTAVALDRGGGTLTLVVVDDPIDAGELAEQLAAAGFDSAILLDGGPSTQLSLRLGSAKLDLPGGYAVPDLLTIVERGRARR